MFEMIEIDENNRDVHLAAMGLRYRLPYPILQQDTVRQTGERVVMRHEKNALAGFLALELHALAFGDIFGDKDGAFAAVARIDRLGEKPAQECGAVAPFDFPFKLERAAAAQYRAGDPAQLVEIFS